MARKHSRSSSKKATTEAAPADNGQAKAAPTKKDAVKEALEMGISSPTKIAEHVKTTHGLDITANYVSVIKGELGKTKKRKGRKPGRKAKTTAGQPAAKPVSAPKEGGLSPQDLRLLSELASRVGGFDRLREFIDVLGNVR
jgi:hypothetical protein